MSKILIERLINEGTKHSEKATDIALAVGFAKYEGKPLMETFAVEDIVRIIGNVCVAQEDELSDGKIGEMIPILSDMVKSKDFKDKMGNPRRKLLGLALLNVGVNLMEYEGALNTTVENLIDEGKFGDEELEFLMGNSDGVVFNGTVLNKLGKCFGFSDSLSNLASDVEDKELFNVDGIDEAVILYRKGQLNESDFFFLIENDIVDIKDIVTSFNMDECNKILNKYKELSEELSIDEDICDDFKSFKEDVEFFNKENDIRKKILDKSITAEELSDALVAFSIDPQFVEDHCELDMLKQVADLGFHKIMAGKSRISPLELLSEVFLKDMLK